MNVPPASVGTPHRQSKLAVALLLFRAVRQFGVAQVVLVLLALSRVPTAALFVVVPVAVGAALAYGVAAWWRFTFVVVADELRVTRGVVSTDTLTVPLDRIQTVAISQPFLHRAIDVVRVSIDTAGASEAEFELDAIARPLATALQQVATERRELLAVEDTDSPPPPPTPERVLARRNAGQLLTIGVTRPAFAGLAVLAPLLAGAEELSTFLPFGPPDLDRPEPGLWLAWVVPVALGAAFVVGLLLNLVQVYLTEWNLALSYHDRGFHRTAGLFTRTARSTNVDRIQILETRQNPLEDQAGIRRVHLSTIGDTDLHLPGATGAEADAVRELVIDPDARVDVLDRRVSPAQVIRDTRNAALGAALIAGAAWWFVGAWIGVLVPLVALRAALSLQENRRSRWGLAQAGIAHRHEVVSVARTEMMLHKLNGARVEQGWYERRRGLATVALQSAAGSIRIGMLPLTEAEAVRDRALAVAETDGRPWM